MRSAKSFLWVLLLPILFLNTVLAQEADDDGGDEDSDITARVARISFERGEAQIKRLGNEAWERAALNLPLVEGDQIATGANARLEIQFSRDQFLRLAENSFLEIKALRDDGVAVSLAEGTLSVRILSFDKDKEFFEIDAPKSTVALQKAGMYRVDAGEKNSKELRVTAAGDGQARIYSEDSGFILRSGRSTKIYLDGDRAGENEIAEAPRNPDEWDSWVSERDAVTAKNLDRAHYDKYYDRQMYGAEDLNDHGEWINTKKYGYVWRPYKNTVAGYADWSPYRYGHWRWVPPYGWTWVNDEPWGWATYHHGRWVFEDGQWCWTPYPYHRPKRSWWKPALVVVVNISNDICWYPLPYERKYRSYNSKHRNDDRRRRRGNRRYDDRHRSNDDGRDRRFDRNVPPTGVVAVHRDRFGNGRRWIQRAPAELGRRVLSTEPSEIETPSLPRVSDSKDRSNEIFVENPRYARAEPRLRTGATERRPGLPLDGELRRSRVWGNRTPTPPTAAAEPQPDPNNSQRPDGENRGNRERRRTGVFERASRPDRRPENTVDNSGTSDIQPQPPQSGAGSNGAEERRRANRNEGDANRPPREERRARPEPPPEEERRERPQPSDRRPETPRSESPGRREESPRQAEPRRETPPPPPKREEKLPERAPERSLPKDEKPDSSELKKTEKDG